MIDLNNNNYFINRELSWLECNNRVLEEALDRTSSVLERYKFLAITASNLDEFFMVRVAGLKDKVKINYDEQDFSGLTPIEQLKEISIKAHNMVDQQYRCLNRLNPLLKENGIEFLDIEELNNEQKEYIENYFEEVLYPILTPMAIDKSRPFPLIGNNRLNLCIRLNKNNNEDYFAIMQVPTVVSRIIEIPDSKGEEKKGIVFLEDIIIEYINKLFDGYTVKSANTFRITKDADLDIDEDESEDLIKEVEKLLKRRKWAEPVRLEINKYIDKKIRKFLISMLNIEEDDIYEVNGPIDLSVFMKIGSLKGYDHLRLKSIKPQDAEDFIMYEDVFKAIKEKDCLVHHPYESFDCVIKFVNQAAEDPNVLAIKQTLYRVSGDSPIIESLIKAAENGKEVTVLVELKARFDEENNVNWAKKLEKAGCHVIYGLVGLKIHCKITLVVRREEDGIKRYVHLGTSNYNDKTAKLYTDIGLFTCKETYASDVSKLFNLLTGYSIKPKWKKLAVAPGDLRQFFIKSIENEIEQVKNGYRGYIIVKMNSLEDEEIIKWLYKASIEGVRIDLIVRGICCLKAGIPKVSENIRVISIIGQLLEHSRIYYFYNGGNEKIYLSSADWMTRNLNRRVEALFPIEQENLKERLFNILDIILKDTVKARIQQSDGCYKRVDKLGKNILEAQVELYNIVSKNNNIKYEGINHGKNWDN